jgi:hypothetical protein
MLIRGTFALGLLLASIDGASAASQSNPFRHVSCVVVRLYVAKYSEPAAEAWARSHGATEAEIDRAKACLGGQPPAQPIQAAAQTTMQ